MQGEEREKMRLALAAAFTFALLINNVNADPVKSLEIADKLLDLLSL